MIFNQSDFVIVEEELQIVTYRDIADEYHVVCAKCELLWQHPDVSVELASKRSCNQDHMISYHYRSSCEHTGVTNIVATSRFV